MERDLVSSKVKRAVMQARARVSKLPVSELNEVGLNRYRIMANEATIEINVAKPRRKRSKS
jgi:hypothetical protein